MSVTDIREVKLSKDPKAILETLDRLREQVIAGDITGIMVAAEHADRTYTISGSGCEDSPRFAGTLLELAVRRLGFEYRQELF